MLELLTEPLLEWYENKKRDLPWRKTTDPYRIWVSEIMLQQTRVEAVKGYYTRFLEAVPDIPSLAGCPEDELLKLWEGLGYYSRVRNMQKAARLMTEQYGGEFPKEYAQVLSLPGIGSYTAGAICSIAFGLPVPAVDGNVLRVLSRVRMDDRDILKQSTKRSIEEALIRVMPKREAASYNQALMELGAMVCLPNGAPHCEECPIARFCLAYRENMIPDYPVKEKKITKKKEQYTVLNIWEQDRVGLYKRKDEGLLAGLYALPQIEGVRTEEEIHDWMTEQGYLVEAIRYNRDGKHIFSHVTWYMTGYDVYIKKARDLPGSKREQELTFHTIKEIEERYSIPTAYVPFLETHGFLSRKQKNKGGNPSGSTGKTKRK